MEKNKQKVLIEYVLTNQCNKRCPYCDLDFHDSQVDTAHENAFLEFLERNNYLVDRWLINFFGWEPLLQFDYITSFLQRTSFLKNIEFSLWTNGLLLGREQFNILASHNVEIYMSVDTQTYLHVLKKDFFVSYKKQKINFIINPETIDTSFFIYKKLYDFWYKNFNIIPVYATIKWNDATLWKLEKFVTFVKLFSDANNYFFSFYEPPTIDSQFILETNGNLYRDLHTHFWFLKQFSIVNKNIKKEIELLTFLNNISANINFNDILDSSQNENLFFQWDLFIKKLGLKEDFIKIHEIIKK